MTAPTDQGLGLGSEDVCGMALAAAKAIGRKMSAGKGTDGSLRCIPGAVLSPISQS